jgi:hypothetical protein
MDPERQGRLLPFFTYYGGKYRAAPHYPKPRHRSIVEPFAGSAGYSLRYHEHNVILVERDPLLAALWRYLVRATPRDFARLPDVGPWESVDDLKIPEEARWLIGFWLNKGAAGPRKTPSAWMRSNLRPNSYWGPAIRHRLVAQAGAIKHWIIVEGEYTAAASTLRAEGHRRATWFVDPPYEGAAGRLYRHDVIDYDALGRWCRSRPGQMIVCENEGATWLPFRPFRSIKSTPGARGKGHSREVIWTKGEET